MASDLVFLDQVTWCIKDLGMHSAFVVVRIILQYCSKTEYKGMASSVSDNDITSSYSTYTTSFLQLWFTLPSLTSTQATRSFVCVQFLYNVKILPMTITECSTTKYRNGFCWKCMCGRTTAPRVGSVLQQSRVSHGGRRIYGAEEESRTLTE